MFWGITVQFFKKLGHALSIAAIVSLQASQVLAQQTPDQMIAAFGIDTSELSLALQNADEVISSLRKKEDLDQDDIKRADGAQDRLKKSTEELLPALRKELEGPVPKVLLDRDIDPNFVTRCSSLSKSLTEVKDSAEREALLGENKFCSERIDAAKSSIAAEIAKLDKEIKENDKKIDEFKKISEIRDLTPEEISIVDDLEKDSQEKEEKKEELSDGSDFLSILQLLIGIAAIVGGIALAVNGNVAAGGQLVSQGLGLVAKASEKPGETDEEGGVVDGKEGGVVDDKEDDKKPPEKGPISEEAQSEIEEVLKQDPSDRSTDEIEAAKEFDGNIIPTGDTGHIYLTSESLGSENAKIRVYVRSNDKLLVEINSSSAIFKPEGLLTTITAISFALSVKTTKGIIVSLKVRVGDKEKTVFLQVLPHRNGYPLLVEEKKDE